MVRFGKNRKSAGIAAVILTCLFAALPLSAQTATGSIVGTVTDPSSAVLPGVSITVTNVDTQVTYQVITNEQGFYQALLLPIGYYTVTGELPGFQKALTKPEKLEINQSLRIDIKLAVGNRTDEVLVEAGISHVETITPTLGMSVTSNQILNIPLNGRNTLDLALLQPGVIPSSAGGTGTFSVAGGRQDSVTYLLDGGVNTDLLSNGVVLNPNPDMVEEFKILTSNYNAEYGRNAGGIVSVVTKTGTNQYHGTAYDYVRNDALNANQFFNNAHSGSHLPKPILKRNQFGGTFGGKAIKDKVFFFSGWQSQRLSQLQTTSQITVFTPNELKGDFSLSNSSKTGPDTNVAAFLQKYPYFQSDPNLAAKAIIDPTKINTVANNYIKAGLIPTDQSGFLISQGSGADNRDEITNKVDFYATPKDRLSATLGWNKQALVNPYLGANVNGYTGESDTKNYLLALNYVKTISPHVLNDFRFTAQRKNILQSVPSVKLPTSTALGIGMISDHPTGPTVLGFSSGMTAGLSVQGPTAEIDNTFTTSDTLTWIKGRHTLKMGFVYTPYQNNTVYDFYVNGELYFRDVGGISGPYSKNDRADFMLGLADEFLQYPEAPSNIRSKNTSGFFQDEWKARRNLTLSFGIRYEYSSPKKDLQGRSFTWALGQQSTFFPGAPKGILFPGDPTAPTGANFPDKNDWAPRFGFAYSPGENTKTSIRGGIGIFYDILKGEDNLQFNGQAPFFGFADLQYLPITTITSEPKNMTQPFVAAGQANPFPSKPPQKNLDFSSIVPLGGSAVYSVDPHLRTPYVYQYNLEIQRELTREAVLSVSYIGSSSHKLTGLYDSNPFMPGTTSRIFNVPSGNASNAFSYLDTFGNVGTGNYNGLAVGVTGRPRQVPHLGSIGYNFAYTHGRSEDNSSGFRTSNSRVPYFNWGRFRSVSDFDLPNVLSVSGSWNVPGFRTTGLSRLTNGWSIIPDYSYRSGQPLDIKAGLSRSRTAPGPSAVGDQGLIRANLVAPITTFDAHVHQPLAGKSAGNFFFDPSSFSRTEFLGTLAGGYDPVNNPSQRSYGTLGRNAFRGPVRNGFDLSLQKTTNITERVQTQFRAEFFNIFNLTEFNNPSTSITSGTFGQVSATADPRIIQLALRLIF
jgi:hypothetical protein